MTAVLCRQVCENVAVEEWSVYRPYPEEMGPYATKGKQWVGYDDEFIVRKKVSRPLAQVTHECPTHSCN